MKARRRRQSLRLTTTSRCPAFTDWTGLTISQPSWKTSTSSNPTLKKPNINPNNTNTTTNMNKEQIAKYIYNYAQEHYEDGGWDVIVECWTIEAIMETLEDDESQEEALEGFKDLVSVWAERQADAVNSAF